MTRIGKDTLVLIALLALIAGVVQWLVWLQKKEERVPSFTGPPRSEYSLNEFEMRALDEQGQLRFIVQAPRLTRDGRDGTFWIDTPAFEIHSSEGGAPWMASATQGWVKMDAKTLQLQGSVELQRQQAGKPALQLRTEKLNADLVHQRLSSPDAVTLKRGVDILTATGLEAEMKTERFRLLKDVHAKLQPES